MNAAPVQACVILAEGTNTCGDNRSDSYTVGLAQVITVDTAAPGSSAYQSTFPVAAHASSGNNVAVTTSGGCTGSGNTTGAGSPVTITMTSGTTACVVYYNQAGGGQWNAAPQVTSTTTASKINQVITVTTAAPASAEMGQVFNVAATSPSGVVTATGSGGCSGTGTGTVPITMTSGTTACTVTYTRATTADYNAAPNVTNTTTASMANQYIDLTTPPPAAAVNGQSFTVVAVSKASTAPNTPTGLGVAITSSGACSGSGTNSANITINAPSGVCTINFNQAGVANNWFAAAQVTKYVSALATSCNGEGTYTAFKLTNADGYLGFACNNGSISCMPTWNLMPGIGFIGHVLATKNNPNKTFRIQAAPDNSGYYNIINVTDATCWIAGDAWYENHGTRYDSNPNAGYLTAIKDSGTGAWTCDYNNDHAKWSFTTAGQNIRIKNKNSNTSIGNAEGLTRVTALMDFGYSDWGDVWTNNLLYDNNSGNAEIVCQGYAPPVPNHIRFEFDPTAASGFPTNVTIKACTTARGAVGSNPTCSPYVGTILLTPVATDSNSNGSAVWSGLSNDPATLFTTTSSGIKLVDSEAESISFSYTNPSVALTDATLECYNTATSKVIDCTVAGGGGVVVGTGAFWIFEHGNTFEAAIATPPPHIYTKLSQVAFPNFGLDIKAGRTVGVVTTTLASYTGSPTVEIIDATTGDGCATSTALVKGAAPGGSVTFAPDVPAAFVAGALTVQPTVGNATNRIAMTSAKLRVKEGTTLTTCSDAFTVRPSHFALTLSSATSPLVSGQIGDTGITPGNASFTLTATPMSGGGSVTAGYTNRPTLYPAKIYDWTNNLVLGAGAIPAGSITPPSTTAAGFSAYAPGTPSSGTFYYDNYGVVNFTQANAVGDLVFADTVSQDKTNGDCVSSYVDPTVPADLDKNFSNAPDAAWKYGCYVGSTTPPTTATSHYRVGYFELLSGLTSAGCGQTYVGTPFGGSFLTLTARSMHGTQLSLLTATAASRPSYRVVPYDNTTVITGLTFNPATLPIADASSWVAGVVSIPNLNAYNVVRGDTPIPAYDQFVLGATVSSTSGAIFEAGQCKDSVGNAGTRADANLTCIPPAATGGTRLRYGILKLENAYGSELLPLDVTVQALYWKSTGGWAPNTLDSCTSTIAPTAVAVGRFRGNLASFDSNSTPLPRPTITPFSSGRAFMRFAAPQVTGSFDVALNLNPALTTTDSSCISWVPALKAANASTVGADKQHFRGAWCATAGVLTYTKDPSAHITFGASKSPYLYRRERY